MLADRGGYQVPWAVPGAYRSVGRGMNAIKILQASEACLHPTRIGDKYALPAGRPHRNIYRSNGSLILESVEYLCVDDLPGRSHIGHPVALLEEITFCLQGGQLVPSIFFLGNMIIAE